MCLCVYVFSCTPGSARLMLLLFSSYFHLQLCHHKIYMSIAASPFFTPIFCGSKYFPGLLMLHFLYRSPVLPLSHVFTVATIINEQEGPETRLVFSAYLSERRLKTNWQAEKQLVWWGTLFCSGRDDEESKKNTKKWAELNRWIIDVETKRRAEESTGEGR